MCQQKFKFIEYKKRTLGYGDDIWKGNLTEITAVVIIITGIFMISEYHYLNAFWLIREIQRLFVFADSCYGHGPMLYIIH